VWHDGGWVLTWAEIFANLHRFRAGEPLRNVVDPTLFY